MDSTDEINDLTLKVSLLKEEIEIGQSEVRLLFLAT